MSTVTVKLRVGTKIESHKFQRAFVTKRDAYVVVSQTDEPGLVLRENWFNKGAVHHLILTETDEERNERMIQRLRKPVMYDSAHDERSE